jgi:multidrug resistance efflux pump
MKVLSEIDEAEANTAAAKRNLEAVQAELAGCQAQLENCKAEFNAFLLPSSTVFHRCRLHEQACPIAGGGSPARAQQ